MRQIFNKTKDLDTPIKVLFLHFYLDDHRKLTISKKKTIEKLFDENTLILNNMGKVRT